MYVNFRHTRDDRDPEAMFRSWTGSRTTLAPCTASDARLRGARRQRRFISTPPPWIAPPIAHINTGYRRLTLSLPGVCSYPCRGRARWWGVVVEIFRALPWGFCGVAGRRMCWECPSGRCKG